MKINYAFIFCLLFSFGLKAQQIDSIIPYPSHASSSIAAITADKAGNIFVAGYMKDTVWIQNKIPIGFVASSHVLYLASYSPQGQLRFKRIVSTGLQEDVKLELDDSGNVYMGTLFTGQMYLDPDQGNYFIKNNGLQGAFILKLSNTGQNRWYTSMVATSGFSKVVHMDYSLSSYGEVLWMASAKGDFNVRSSQGNTVGVSNVGNNNSNRYGTVILRSQLNGYYAARPIGVFGNSSSITDGMSMLEKDGKIVFSGQLVGTTDFDPSTGTKNITSSSKAFICCVDTSMVLQWVKLSNLHQINRLECDAYGNIMGFGTYSGTGVVHLEMIKLDLNGNILREYSQDFLSGLMEISDLSADLGGNIFVAGTFKGYGDFDPTSGTKSASSGYYSAFVAKYDSAFKVGLLATASSNVDFVMKGKAVFIAPDNKLYWAGSYARTANFTGNSGKNLPYTTSMNGFVAYFTECKTLQARVTPSDTVVCKGEMVSFEVKGAKSCLWDDQNTSLTRLIKADKSLDYQVKVSNDSGCFKNRIVKLEVFAEPKPVITLNGNKLILSGSWTSIEWYINGQKITGETQSEFTPSKSGDVYCKVKDSNACDGMSNTVVYKSNTLSQIQTNGIRLYTSGHKLILDMAENPEKGRLELFDLTGREVFSADVNDLRSEWEITRIPTQAVYWVRISNVQQETLFQSRIFLNR